MKNMSYSQNTQSKTFIKFCTRKMTIVAINMKPFKQSTAEYSDTKNTELHIIERIKSSSTKTVTRITSFLHSYNFKCANVAKFI